MNTGYVEWVREEAALIHADGCTGVSNIEGWCCLQHDLEFSHGKSAADAYRHYRLGATDYWALAKPVTFEEANAHFRACHLRSSRLGYFNPLAWWRWAAMRAKATRKAWDAHRAREAAQV